MQEFKMTLGTGQDKRTETAGPSVRPSQPASKPYVPRTKPPALTGKFAAAATVLLQPGDHRFRAYIDGSGSMVLGNALDKALDATRLADGKIETLFTGDSEGAVSVPIDGKFRGPLNLNGTLAPSVKSMRDSSGKGKTRDHFIVINDGDVPDLAASFGAFCTMLIDRPKATVDFITLRGPFNDAAPGAAEVMAKKLSKAFPKRVSYKRVLSDEEHGADKAVAKIILKRAQPKPKK